MQTKTRSAHRQQVGVRLVNLHRNLHSEQERIGLVDELEDLILAGFAQDNELLVAAGGGI